MLKINDSYRIIKGWPKIKKSIMENEPSVSAYIIDKERVAPFKLSFQEYNERISKRLEIENKIKEYDKLSEEGNDTEFKKFFNLEYMIYSDDKDVPYPSAYNGDKIQEIFDSETEITEIEIDDYLKTLSEEYYNKNHDLIRTSDDKINDNPIWILRKTD